MGQGTEELQEPLKALSKLLGKKGVAVAFGLACQMANKRLSDEEWQQVAAEWLAVAERHELAKKDAFSIKWYRPFMVAVCQPMHSETHRVYYASLKEVTVRKKSGEQWRLLQVPQSLNLYHVSDDDHDMPSAHIEKIIIKPRKKKARKRLAKKPAASPQRANGGSLPPHSSGRQWTVRVRDQSLR